MGKILVLSPEDCEKNRPTKILDKNLNKIKSFNAGFNFYFETFQYKNIHDALTVVSQLENSFITLGELTDHGMMLEETEKTGQRRKKKGEPTIRDCTGDQIVLDLDDHILDGFDPLDPEKGIKSWLAEREISCDVTWQITSGQKLNSEEARIRLYFEITRPESLGTRKAWSQSPEIAADGSVYTCSQPIYTCAPIIEGGEDPIKSRWGFIKGDKRKFKLPKMPESEIKKYSGNVIGGGDWNFDDFALPDEVMDGKVYRRYFMPLAFHYANKLKGDRDAIFAIIASKASLVKSREFSVDNTYAFIDDAINKITTEDTASNDDTLSSDEIKSDKSEVSDIPAFPEDLLASWPEPWPMIWENFKSVPRQLEESLLVPTVLATNAFFLRANFVTSYNRRPNMFFLNLTPSTGNKDVNSKNVIRDLDIIFKREGHLQNHFTGILNTESNITADSTFLQSFDSNEELFWVNTEATRIFQQIKMAGAVSAVAALSDKLIEVVDGHEITGKIKAAGTVKTIQNPNAQILFYAQPETIERYIDESMVDSGLFGRSLLSIVPELKFEIDSYEMFKIQGGSNIELDPEFIAFYNSQEFNMSTFTSGKAVLQPSKKSRDLLNQWARDYVAPKMAEDESFQKVLSRIGNSAEQLYCIILGICQISDMSNKVEVRKEISVADMIPLLEYWVDTKIYAIKHFINTELDPLAESILEIIRNCIDGTYKMSGSYDSKSIKKYNMICKAAVMNRLKSNTKLIRKLSADGDKRNAVVRADQIIRTFVNSGTLKQMELKIGTSTKECLGLAK